MVTGADLVREQLLVASGQRLSMRQSELAVRGAAVECRVNAEDPSCGFVPAPGLLDEFEPPGGPFVRVDTHAYAGYRIPSAYDSLLAKTIVWAPDREQALARMTRALRDFRVRGRGVRTTVDFLLETINHPLFVDAKHDTNVVEAMLADRE
jgi:acetyl-CoA carboxylase biotin carboxylase subunit